MLSWICEQVCILKKRLFYTYLPPTAISMLQPYKPHEFGWFSIRFFVAVVENVTKCGKLHRTLTNIVVYLMKMKNRTQRPIQSHTPIHPSIHPNNGICFIDIVMLYACSRHIIFNRYLLYCWFSANISVKCRKKNGARESVWFHNKTELVQRNSQLRSLYLHQVFFLYCFSSQKMLTAQPDAIDNIV